MNRGRTQGLHPLKRVGKQLLAAKEPNRKEAEWQPKQSQLTLSHGSDEGYVIVDEDDDG